MARTSGPALGGLDSVVVVCAPARANLLDTACCSHRCGWDALVVDGADGARSASEVLERGADWTRRWTVTWRHAGGDVISLVRDLGSMPVASCQPVRRFSWRRGQRHRSGLQLQRANGVEGTGGIGPKTWAAAWTGKRPR